MAPIHSRISDRSGRPWNAPVENLEDRKPEAAEIKERNDAIGQSYETNDWICRAMDRRPVPKNEIDWDDPDNGHPRRYLKSRDGRVRSDRPFVEEVNI